MRIGQPEQQLSRKGPLVEASVARRLLLGAQGLLDDPGRPAKKKTVLELVQKLGYVQVDSISAVGERAHHLTLHSRMDGYRPALLTALIEQDRKLFEHWTHDASVIPVEWYPHWKVRFARFRCQDRVKSWCVRRLGADPARVLRRVRARLRAEGPLMARDFEADGVEEDDGSGWWNWHPEKAALEYLWRSGEVSIVARRGFQRVYQLTRQVLLEASRLPASSASAHLEFACRQAMERLVIANPAEIARYFAAAPLADVRRWCNRELERGALLPVQVRCAETEVLRPALALPDFRERERALPVAADRARLLSPFDPVVRDRARALRLFGFDFRFEAFVPERQRKFGYYVMPLLDGEHIVGRLEPKYHREASVLEVKNCWWQADVRGRRSEKRRALSAVERLAALVGAERIDAPALD